MNEQEISDIYRLLMDGFNSADWTKVEEAIAYLEDYIEDTEEEQDY